MKDCNLTCFVGLILIQRVRVGFELTITVSSRSASGKNAAIMISSLITKGRTFFTALCTWPLSYISVTAQMGSGSKNK